jgi:methionyl-tRNA formyltransferase
MRLVFMGTPEFAVQTLDTLAAHRYEIAAVVTAPDKPRGRGLQVSFSPVKTYALEHHIHLLQPEKLNDARFIASLKALQPDLIVVVAFRILPRDILLLPKQGSFNLHASLLPKFRGAAPINWAILKGEKETGVTSFVLQEKVDTGAILLQEKIPIGENETAGELHDRLAVLGAEVVLRSIRLIESGGAQTVVQDESLATPAPKIFKHQCRIPWQETAQTVHNFIRGLSPYPCAWTVHRRTTLRIFCASMEEEEFGGAPGTVISVSKNSLLVGTGNGAVAIKELQQEGKRRLGIEEFLRGYPLAAGDLFL